MRCLAFLAFLLSLQAQPPKLAPPEPRTLENIKQFPTSQNLSCNQVESQSNTRTITIELVDPSTPNHGARSDIDTGALFQDVFSVSKHGLYQIAMKRTLRIAPRAVYAY